MKVEPLNPYYQKVSEYELHAGNDKHFRGEPAAFRRKVWSLQVKIAEIEAENAKVKVKIPEAEASVQEHERILTEGLPEAPVVPVVRLETIAVEGEEMQSPLFPEAISAADTRD